MEEKGGDASAVLWKNY